LTKHFKTALSLAQLEEVLVALKEAVGTHAKNSMLQVKNKRLLEIKKTRYAKHDTTLSTLLS
jgi:hypothetical protein